MEAILGGLGLAGAAGLNAYIPLPLLALAGRFGYAELGTPYDHQAGALTSRAKGGSPLHPTFVASSTRGSGIRLCRDSVNTKVDTERRKD